MMHQNYKKFNRGERLIRYAIEIFDLVEIAPAASSGKFIDHRLFQPDASPATPYAETQNLSPGVGRKH